jgi:hypothetical protein
LTSRTISANSMASSGRAKIGSPLETRLQTWYDPPSISILGFRTIARPLLRQPHSTSQGSKAWHSCMRHEC